MSDILNFVQQILKKGTDRLSYKCDVINAGDESILLLHPGWEGIKQSTDDDKNLKCWKLDDWFEPPAPIEGVPDSLTIGILVNKLDESGNQNEVGGVEPKADKTSQYKFEMLNNKFKIKIKSKDGKKSEENKEPKAFSSKPAMKGFHYEGNHLIVRGHEANIEAIFPITEEIKKQILHVQDEKNSYKKNIYKEICNGVRQSVQHNYQRAPSGTKEPNTEALEAQLVQLENGKPTFLDTSKYDNMLQAHWQQLKNILHGEGTNSVTHRVARVYCTSPYLETLDEMVSALLSCMTVLMKFSVQLPFGEQIMANDRQSLNEMTKHLKEELAFFEESMESEDIHKWRNELKTLELLCNSKNQQSTSNVVETLNESVFLEDGFNFYFPTVESKRLNSSNFPKRFKLFKARFQLIHHEKLLQSSNFVEIKDAHFKDIHEQMSWIYTCQHQMVHLLFKIFLDDNIGDNLDVVKSLLQELLQEKRPRHLIKKPNHFKPFEKEMKSLLISLNMSPDKSMIKEDVKKGLADYGRALESFFDQCESGSLSKSKEVLSKKFDCLENVRNFLIECKQNNSYGENLQERIIKRLGIRKRDWLTTDGVVSYYHWAESPIEVDPYYTSNKTHVPLYISKVESKNASHNQATNGERQHSTVEEKKEMERRDSEKMETATTGSMDFAGAATNWAESNENNNMEVKTFNDGSNKPSTEQ